MRGTVLLLSALLVAGGCTDPGPGQDNGPAPLEVTERAPDVTETRGDRADVLPLPDLTGMVYLATELVATAPTDQLNEAWAVMVAEYTLAIALVVVAHDVANQSMELDLTSAWVDRSIKDGEPVQPLAYRFALEPVRVTLRFNGPEFTIDQTFAIDLVPMAVNKPFHVHGAIGSGRFSSDGQEIAELRLEGYLDEAQMVDFCLHIPGLGDVNFHWFMNLVNLCADADSDQDGTPDSYLFKGLVKATADTGLFEPGVHAIQPQISDCAPHTQACQAGRPPP